ncbi:hypothetical protein Vspart_04097 [Vibrio spartinae]|uniref:Uncharacterized protein n=1 Tax=Vibrio spartinae TaxID=1918945 RepID=A0A1N6MAN3_9VIBR|nr:hypothetical protein Vspart_04097 [Vibrio spartinae]SIO96518.1 hypothetical protein VSP9026_04318 [Vibrio spartinae]
MFEFGFLMGKGDFWNGNNRETQFLKIFHPIQTNH